MPTTLNRSADSRARSLIKQGKIDHGPWDESKVPRTAGNASSFLGTDPAEKPQTEAHWKYPVISGGKVSRKAVGSAIAYAKKNGDAAIAKAAQALSDLMDKAAPKDEPKPAAAAAATSAKPEPRVRHAALRAPVSYSDSGVTVDLENGIIQNAALLTVGAAKGHPFDIDATTVQQLIAFVNASPDGIKSRFKHPGVTEKTDAEGNVIAQQVADDTGMMVGRVKNARPEAGGMQARGDIHLGDYAADVPGLGDVRGYLLKFAQEDPAGIGMSAFFPYEIEPQLDDYGNILARPARLLGLDAIDFVGTPAANPRGLLSAAILFDPQPPSAAPNTPGWSDPKPADQAKAPLPAGTPEHPSAPDFPDVRDRYLAEIVRRGPLTLGHLASRFSGRLEAMHATCEALASNGFVKKSPRGAVMTYEATPAGTARMAARGVWKQK